MNTLAPEFEKIVNEQLDVLKNRIADKWIGSSFEVVKNAGQTQKGDFGEAITEALLNEIGISFLSNIN
jgi:RNase P/RNase MRP subunit POP5